MWERFQEWALNEVAEVKRAPVAIVVLLMFGFIGGFVAAQQFYAERMAVLELRAGLSGQPIPAPSSPRSLVWPSRALWAATGLALVVAVLSIRAARRSRSEASALVRSVDQLQVDRQRLVGECDAATAALKDEKREYAIRTLQRYSNLRLRDGIRPNLSIRYYAYGHDYELAKLIEELFRSHVHWDVKLDPQNGPALPPEKDYKVVFDVGMTFELYGDLVHAFNQGNLLGVTVGWRNMTSREDVENLIVEVLPSTSVAPKDKAYG